MGPSISVRTRLDQSLERIADPSGEGRLAFARVFDDAPERADDLDRRHGGGRTGDLSGMLVSIKDNIEVAGKPTTAGSVVLKSAPAARRDAPVVARLRQAGALLVGQTTMTEFAFSGLGLNPHWGTPANPWGRAERRIPGGSSSGAAVSVADRMVDVAIGTDTGGSVRIPAALCGLVGFKPTAARISREGVLPLSETLDSVGVIAAGVDACRTVFGAVADVGPRPRRRAGPEALRLLVAQGPLFDGLDAAVSGAFAAALARLSAAGCEIVEADLPVVGEVLQAAALGTFAAIEGYAWHRRLLETSGDLYDPRVRARLLPGGEIRAADYIELIAVRRRLMRQSRDALLGFDAMVFPTTPTVAPLIAALEADDALYHAVNRLMLRNSSVVNFLDGCAISLPCHVRGAPPVGLTLARLDGDDEALFDVAGAAETVLHARD